jgi:lysophospholipase L1-like esterase
MSYSATRRHTRCAARLAAVLLVPTVVAAGLSTSHSTSIVAAQIAPVRIMPLGDSLTHGYNVPGAYRTELEGRLLADGISFDFVGSHRNGPAELADKDHQGVVGATINTLLGSFRTWLDNHPADVILLMIGTNDVKLSDPAARNPAAVAERLRHLLVELTSYAPSVNVIVSTIPPQRGEPGASGARDYNSLVPGVVHQVAANGGNVRFIDGAANLTTADLYDSVHLTADGFAKLAAAWYTGLEPLVTTTTPPTTTTSPTNPSPPTTDPPPEQQPPSGNPGADYQPLGPSRLFDTRAAGTTTDNQHARTGPLAADTTYVLPVTGRGGAPDNATAAAVNITVLDADNPGFVTAHPCNTRPDASTINFTPGPQAIANGVIVPLSNDGDICIYTSTGANILLDLAGTFTDDPTGTGYEPLGPSRLLDTRASGNTIDNQHARTGPLAADTTYVLPVTGRGGAPDNATAAAVNITVLDADNPGFATLHPCTTSPDASTINFTPGPDAIANGVIVPLSPNGDICIYTSTGANFLIDLAGMFGP